MNASIHLPEDASIKDRRKRKTQNAIEMALIELLHEKPMSAISIRELAEKADVNRKTFYNNYDSVEDVIHGIDCKLSKYLMDKLPKHITIENEVEIYKILLELAENMAPYKELLYRVTSNRGSILLMAQFQSILLPYIQHCFDEYHVHNALSTYITSYLTNGLSTLYFEWFQKDDLTAKQLARLAYNLTVSAIHLENYKDIL